MKNFPFILIFLFTIIFSQPVFAQGDEGRTKIQMTINYGGKTVVTDLNSIGTSLSRGYEEEQPSVTAKDSVKTKPTGYSPNAFYLTIEAKKISDDLLTVFAKKQNRFDGTITIVDTYGKNPTRTIKFKQASLYTYSDQLSAGPYNEGYGSAGLSFTCKEVSINGILIEQ